METNPTTKLTYGDDFGPEDFGPMDEYLNRRRGLGSRASLIQRSEEAAADSL